LKYKLLEADLEGLMDERNKKWLTANGKYESNEMKAIWTGARVSWLKVLERERERERARGRVKKEKKEKTRGNSAGSTLWNAKLKTSSAVFVVESIETTLLAKSKATRSG
jgi:hypothetical protein